MKRHLDGGMIFLCTLVIGLLAAVAYEIYTGSTFRMECQF